MSEETKNDEKTDAVKMEEYNRVVGAHNEAKAELSKVQKELEEMKSSQTKKEEENVWKKETEDMKKQMEELKKQIEKKDETKVSKGVVTEQPRGYPQQQTDVLAMINEKLPNKPVNPEKYGSNLQRYGHYKSPSSKFYTNEQLGMGLSLHAGAQFAHPELIRREARLNPKVDIILG